MYYKLYEARSDANIFKTADVIANSIIRLQYERKIETYISCDVIINEESLNVICRGDYQETIFQQEYEKHIREILSKVGYKRGFRYQEEGEHLLLDKDYNYKESEFLDTEILSPEMMKITISHHPASHFNHNYITGEKGYGFASVETSNNVPLGHALVEKICHSFYNYALSGINNHASWIHGCDMTVQLLMEYDSAEKYYKGEGGRIDTLYAWIPHVTNVSLDVLKEIFIEEVKKIDYFKEHPLKKERVIVNPNGALKMQTSRLKTGMNGQYPRFETNAILSGDKCGKDPFDLSIIAGCAGRYIAKNIVALGWAKSALVEVAFLPDGNKLLINSIETFGTSIVKGIEEKCIAWIHRNDFFRKERIDWDYGKYHTLNMHQLENYDFPWEKIDCFK